MKKFTYSVFLFTCLFSTINLLGMTVHIHGTVTADSTGLPIANHEVSVFADTSNSSGFFYYASTQTNQIGSYEFNIENVPDTGVATEFHIRTWDCQNVLHDTLVYSNNSPILANFVICYNALGDCEANFISDPDTSLLYMFYFYDSSTASSNIVSWAWSFGDPSSGLNNVSTLQNPYHLYGSPGIYTVCLTIQTATTCSNTYCGEVIAGNENCHAQFVDYPDSTTNDLKVHFISTSTGNYTSLLWNFGDTATGLKIPLPHLIHGIPSQLRGPIMFVSRFMETVVRI